eukprot:563784-Prymnesium_polylepis.1
MCGNQHLLTDVLRGEWGFDGYVTSDCGAINDIQVNHHFAPDGPTAAAMGLKAGCDTDCGGVYGGHVIDAVNRSILSEATIDVRAPLRLKPRRGCEPRRDCTWREISDWTPGGADCPQGWRHLAVSAIQHPCIPC